MGIYAKVNGEWKSVDGEGGSGGGTFDPAKLLSDPVAVTNATTPTNYTVKLTDGTSKKIWFLPGNTGSVRSLAIAEKAQESVDEALRQAVLTTEVPDDFEGDPMTLLPKKLRAEVQGFVEVRATPQPEAVYSVTLGAGVLSGVMVGAGGAGGSCQATYYGGGGGSGAVIGQGAHVPVILPGQEDTMYTITVASTSPGGSAAGVPALRTGMPTTIAVEGQEPFQAAIGGGTGWCWSTVSLGASSGASGGGGFGTTPLGVNNYGLGTPGVGNDGGNTGPSGSYATGGGGYSSLGVVKNGGTGFDLATALNLDAADGPTKTFLDLVSVDGWIAGGGATVSGTATAGGGPSTANAKDYTGGGGGGHGAAVSGSGGSGMVLLVTNA